MQMHKRCITTENDRMTDMFVSILHVPCFPIHRVHIELAVQHVLTIGAANGVQNSVPIIHTGQGACMNMHTCTCMYSTQ